ASNPTTPITPGDNIMDPGDTSTPWGGCVPTDSNCYVSTPWTTTGDDISYITGNVSVPNGQITAGEVLTNGSYTASAITYSASTLTGAATALTLDDDDMTAPITIPFTFEFYGTDYTELCVVSNGFVSLTCDDDDYDAQDIPDVTVPNGAIFAFHDDYNPEDGGTISYETLGTTPNRIFVVEYLNVPDYDTTGFATFQIKLFETTNNIEVHTLSTTFANSNEKTQGVENQDGTEATVLNSGRKFTEFNLTNDGVRFTYVPPGPLALGSGTLAVQNESYFGGNISINGDTTIIENDLTVSGVTKIQGLTVGKGSGSNNDFNTAFGDNALLNNTTGYDNTAVGFRALKTNTSGFDNSAVGNQALLNNTTGYFNTALGTYALVQNTSGFYNVAIGAWALLSNTTGDRNVALGSLALQANTTGYRNTAVSYSLASNTTGAFNVALGNNSLNGNTTGNGNIALGYAAGANITTGSNNIVLGYNIHSPTATNSNTLNIGNLIFGTGVDGAGTSLSSGNIGIGTTSPSEKLSIVGNIQASNVKTTYDQTQLGQSALGSLTTGTENTAIGAQALVGLTTGTRNTGIGGGALSSLTTGSENVALGTAAGSSYNAEPITSGVYNIMLGDFSGVNIGGGQVSSAIALGPFSRVGCSGCFAVNSFNGSSFGHINTSIGGVSPAVSFNVMSNPSDLTGTISFSSGSTAVTGSGTSFTTQLVVGSEIRLDIGNGEVKRITAITSDTSLAVDTNWSTSGSGALVHTINPTFAVNNANVGIGTTLPAEKLTIGGGNILLDNNYSLKMKSSNGTAYTVIIAESDGSLSYKGYLGTNVIYAVNGATYLYGSGSGDIVQTITTAGNIGIGLTAPADLLHLTTGNLRIGASTDVRGTTAGTNQVILFDGTAPVGTLTNGISLYSTGGELRVMDAAGNATLLSPHENTNNYWVFDSANAETGKSLVIDMELMMKKLNATFGWNYVHEIILDENGDPIDPDTLLTDLNVEGSDASVIPNGGMLAIMRIWLADAGNGITDFFANRVHTETLCLGNKGDETCINKAQLDEILQNQNTPTPPAPEVVAPPESDPSTGSGPSAPTPEEVTPPQAEVPAPADTSSPEATI
ncbi:MAG: hypothetical protein ABIR14_00280, partial [Candidatus Paceibacterota bacterium]